MSDTQLIKDKIDIVDFIGEYVQLKPAGSTHKAPCPFHQEKTPSFMVSRERQRWHCFGCNQGGDIFTFLQEIEGMDFVEALKHLAGRAGITLSHSFQQQSNTSQKNRLKDVMLAAARFYHNVLTQMDAAGGARAYLQQRGIANETLEAWQVGYVPDQWDLLTKYLLKKGHSVDDLVASGLTIKRDGANAGSGKGFYDRFRGRVMFPIRDTHGAVVGFTGRLLEEKEGVGKYINTPQTILFDKSRILFGLDSARRAIKQEDVAVLVEGQMDVIAIAQYGMKNVVASSGTALTEHQVKILGRYSKNLKMAFDMDAAGVKAAKRGIDLALQAGMNVQVIRIPDGAGNDPDECIKKDPAVWEKAVKEAQDVMQWYIDRAFTGRSAENPKDKQKIVNELLPEIARIPYAVEQDHWLQDVAKRLRVGGDILREDLKRVVATLKKPERQQETQSSAKAPAKEEPAVMDRFQELHERLITLVLATPEIAPLVHKHADDLQTERSVYSDLYEAFKRAYTHDVAFSLQEFQGLLGEDGMKKVDILLMKGELDFSDMDVQQRIADAEMLITEILKLVQKKKRERLLTDISEAEKNGDQEKVKELLAIFQNVGL